MMSCILSATAHHLNDAAALPSFRKFPGSDWKLRCTPGQGCSGTENKMNNLMGQLKFYLHLSNLLFRGSFILTLTSTPESTPSSSDIEYSLNSQFCYAQLKPSSCRSVPPLALHQLTGQLLSPLKTQLIQPYPHVLVSGWYVMHKLLHCLFHKLIIRSSSQPAVSDCSI